MTTLVINGKNVTVSDDFLKLSPDQQNATVDEIAKSMGSAPAATPTEAPQYATSGVPRTEADKTARISSAKAGTLTIPQATVDRQKGIDALAEAWMLFDSANPGKADRYGMDKAKPPPAPGSTYTYKPDIPADIAAIKDPRQKAAEMQRRGYGTASFVVQDPRLGAGTALADAIANGASLGWGDELASGLLAMGDQTYEGAHNRIADRMKLGAELYPGASTAGNIGGGLLAPGLGTAKLVSKAPGWFTKVLAGMAGGSTVGGVMAAGNADPGERLAAAPGGMILGGLLGGGITGLASGVGSLINNAATKRAVAKAAEGAQTADELRGAAGGIYDAIDNMGAKLPRAAFPADDIMSSMRALDRDKLAGTGSATPRAEKLTLDMMDIATDPKFAGGIPMSALQRLRSNFSEVTADVGPGMFPRPTQDAKAAIEGIGKVDDVIDNLVGGANKDATGMWARAIRTGKLQEVMDTADSYVSGFTSGVRNKLKSILKDKRSQRGYSPAELDAMRQIIKGGPVEAVARIGGSGLAKLLATAGGLSTGNIPGMIAGYAGTKTAGELADMMTKSNLDALIRAVSTGKLQSTSGIPQGLLDAVSARLGTGAVATTTPGLLAQ